jgi:hypothetical protein
MQRTLSFALSIILLFTVSAFAQTSSVEKPKLGSGTITGVIKPSRSCAGGGSVICVGVGSNYVLQLDTAYPRQGVIVGGSLSSLTPGKRVSVTYQGLSNSEMDYGRLFTGHAAQVTILGAVPFMIGLVDNSRNQYRDGCGCGFWPVGRKPKFNDPQTQKYILIGNYDKQAWMNIDGNIVQLRLVKDTTKYKGRKGARYYQTYQSGNTTVNVECVATGYGDTHALFCNSTITVIKGAKKQTLKAVGDCGC